MKLIITAGALIFDQQKRILLVLRPKDKKLFPHVWALPGGKLEEDERLEDCVKREVKEETNLDFIPLHQYNFTEYFTDQIHNISHLYVGNFSGEIFNDGTVKWCSKEELKNLEIAFDYKNIIDKF